MEHESIRSVDHCLVEAVTVGSVLYPHGGNPHGGISLPGPPQLNLRFGVFFILIPRDLGGPMSFKTVTQTYVCNTTSVSQNMTTINLYHSKSYIASSFTRHDSESN
jgi:hypothetical protein